MGVAISQFCGEGGVSVVLLGWESGLEWGVFFGEVNSWWYVLWKSWGGWMGVVDCKSAYGGVETDLRWVGYLDAVDSIGIGEGEG